AAWPAINIAPRAVAARYFRIIYTFSGGPTRLRYLGYLKETEWGRKAPVLLNQGLNSASRLIDGGSCVFGATPAAGTIDRSSNQTVTAFGRSPRVTARSSSWAGQSDAGTSNSALNVCHFPVGPDGCAAIASGSEPPAQSTRQEKPRAGFSPASSMRPLNL